jgi:DNA adenine methylase
MKQHDAPTTLHFVDPPYLHSTRVLQSKGHACYQHEMNDAEHAELLEALFELEGFVVVSGYPSDLCSDRLSGWKQCETKARFNAGRGSALRTDVV